MSQPDLFVVCKNCGSEVSPYVTECPYCGQRVRRRAPKIERPGDGHEEEPAGRRRPRLTRLRAREIEGIAPDSRPVATATLVGVSLAMVVVLASGAVTLLDGGGIFVGIDTAPWRYVTAPFVHDSLGYAFVALAAVALFGSMLERRFGPLAVLLVYLAAGAAGAAAAVAVDLSPPFTNSGGIYAVLGANGAALGLLAAWLVDDRRARARGDDRENDLIGVYVFAAVLLLLPLAVAEASAVAGVAGALTGALLAPLLRLVARR